MTKTNSLTLAMALATLTGLSAHAQGFTVYENSINSQAAKTGRLGIEIGDEINLTAGSPVTVNQFQFEYHFNGTSGGANGVVRFYAKDFTGTLEPGGDAKPGTLLFESQSFSLNNGFNTGTINDLSVTVPTKFIWTIQFTGLDGAESPGLLYYDGAGSSDAAGQSRDDHWERSELNLSDWVLVNNGGFVDNFAAKVVATPEPTTLALGIAGAAALIAARRRKA